MTTDIPKPPAFVRILVVDDHPFFREGITTWIERQNNFAACGHADSAATAIAAIGELKPDVVLLDLQLREGDGFDVLRAIKTMPSPPCAIVVSHKDETIFAERSLRAGARGYILKEEASDTMLTAIHTVLNGGVHVSTAMRRQLFQQDTLATQPADKLRDLYNRELQVLQLLGLGRTTKEIAQELSISPKTVEFYRESLKRKLGVADSLALVRLATIWQHEGRLKF